MSAFLWTSWYHESHQNISFGCSYSGPSVNHTSRFFHRPLNKFPKSSDDMATFIIAVIMQYPLPLSIMFTHYREAIWQVKLIEQM